MAGFVISRSRSFNTESSGLGFRSTEHGVPKVGQKKADTKAAESADMHYARCGKDRSSPHCDKKGIVVTGSRLALDGKRLAKHPFRARAKPHQTHRCKLKIVRPTHIPHRSEDDNHLDNRNDDRHLTFAGQRCLSLDLFALPAVAQREIRYHAFGTRSQT